MVPTRPWPHGHLLLALVRGCSMSSRISVWFIRPSARGAVAVRAVAEGGGLTRLTGDAKAVKAGGDEGAATRQTGALKGRTVNGPANRAATATDVHKKPTGIAVPRVRARGATKR